MNEQRKFKAEHSAARFKREFFDSSEEFTYIGSGEFGGKASGLAFARDLLAKGVNASDYADMIINIPRLTVLTTDVFDAFMTRNKLSDVAYSDAPDDRIAHALH